jgi:ATP-dependent RNA helicase DbpA
MVLPNRDFVRSALTIFARFPTRLFLAISGGNLRAVLLHSRPNLLTPLAITLSDTSFSSLALPKALLGNLENLNYLEMTAIQAAALPPTLAGKDVIAQAKTGSGKTAAFGLPLLTKINPRDFGAQALILCPTRELAAQVATEIRRLARYQQNIKVVTLCGGQPIGPQIGSLEHGAHIIVGTPGRIKDHLRKKTLSIARVSTLVLDEADRMLEMGFKEDIEGIVGNTPEDRQTLLFSATYPEDIQSLSARFQTAPQRITVESLHSEQKIDQKFFICQKSNRLASLAKLLAHFQPASVVIFCNTRQLTNEVRAYLNEAGIRAAALHGDMEQRDRDQVLIHFKHLSHNVLVATDVAARGLDIDDLGAVINFELPRSADVYVHRIGRTGRAGKNGLAVSLFADSERYKLQAIGDYLQQELDFEAIEALQEPGHTLPPPPFVTLEIAGGRKDKIRPGDILGALTGDAGVDGKSVGKITVTDRSAYVAISRDTVEIALQGLRNGKIKGRKLKVRKL